MNTYGCSPKQAVQVTWELKRPRESRRSPFYPTWLRELQSLRGRILYENGLRSCFKISEKRFIDKDNFDLVCYHILAKYNHEIIGGIRLLPLSSQRHCVTEEAIGKEAFNKIIHDYFSNDLRQLSEMSRWIVDPNYQKMHIGRFLMYAVWALADHLGLSFIANSGFKTKTFIKYYGALYLSNPLRPYYSKKYNDDINVLFFNKKKLSKEAVKHIKTMKQALQLINVNVIGNALTLT